MDQQALFYNPKGGNYIRYNGQNVPKRAMWAKGSNEMLNGVTLTLNASYGNYQYPIRKNTFFIGDDTIIYLCGRHIVEYDIIRKKQSFITKSIEDEAVTSMTFYRSKKNILKIAVGLKGNAETLPQVKVYNTNKNYSYALVHSGLSAHSVIVDLAMGIKGKYILTLAEVEKNEKYVGSLWYIDKERLSGSFTLHGHINRVEVNPFKQAQFSVSGKNYFKIWEFDVANKAFEVNKESTKVFEAIQNENIVDHCWLADNNYLIAATGDNNIFIYLDNALVKKFEFRYMPSETKGPKAKDGDSETEENELNEEGNSLSEDKDEDEDVDILGYLKAETQSYSIACIEATSRGFAIGLKNIGALCIYEIDKNNELDNLGTFKVKEDHVYGIHSISTSADDLYLAISVLSHNRGHILDNTKDKEAVSGNMLSNLIARATYDPTKEEMNFKLDLFIFNKAVVDAVKSVHKDPFEPLFEKGVHTGCIKTIAICPTKTIITSLAVDRTLKFWEFGTENREIFSQFFHEHALCVAIHPLSIQVAVGFTEGIRFYYFLEEDLPPVYIQSTNIRACTCLQYSEGGNYLAAGSEHGVNIYDPYTFQIRTTLKGHSASIRDIQWLHNDRLLMTVCVNGIVIVWDTAWNSSREVEGSFKTPKHNAFTYDPDYDLLIGCTEDGKTRFLTEKGTSCIFEYDSSPVQHTSVLISKKQQVVFFGTNIGSVRLFLWPLTEFQKDNIEYIEFPIHQSAVVSLKLTHDNSTLITASEDGSIFLLKVKEYIDGSETTNYDVLNNLNANRRKDVMGKFVNAYLLNSLALVGRTNMEGKRDSIKQLEFKIQNAKSDIQDRTEKFRNDYGQKIKHIEEKNRDSTIRHKETMATAMEQAESKQKKLIMEMDVEKKKLEDEMEKLEKNHNKNLLKLYEQNDELKAEMQSLKDFCAKEIEKYEAEFQSTLKQADVEYQEKYLQLVEKYNSTVVNMKLDEKKFKEALTQSEEDYEEEFGITEAKLARDLEAYKKSNEELRTMNTKNSKEIEKFRENYIEVEARTRDFSNQNEQLEKDNHHFVMKLEETQRQLAEKESTINQKEQQIKEFRNKNIHLQNFRSVYDHRVSTLNEEHGPLVEYLENMEKHIKTIYKELLDEANSNKRLREQITDKNEKIDDLADQVKQKADILSVFRRANELFEYDVLNLIRDTNFETWEDPLKTMKDTYINRMKNLDSILFAKPENMGNLFEDYKDKAEETQKKNVQQAIREELTRQRNFMNQKLFSVSKFNADAESERENTYNRIQSENTNLINECNFLRKEKHLIQNKIGLLEKQARDLAKELNESYLDAYRTKTVRPAKASGEDQDFIESSNQTGGLRPLLNKKELPFVKYQADKRSPQQLNGTNLKKMYTNEILHSLMKEIDKYNDQQVQQHEMPRIQNNLQNFLNENQPDANPNLKIEHNARNLSHSPQKGEHGTNFSADSPVRTGKIHIRGSEGSKASLNSDKLGLKNKNVLSNIMNNLNLSFNKDLALKNGNGKDGFENQ